MILLAQYLFLIAINNKMFRCTHRGFDVLGSAQSSSLPQSPPPGTVTPAAAPRAKSPDTKERKSITSLCSNGSIGEGNTSAVRSPSPSPTPKSIGQALPEIQITRTESNRSTQNEKWVKPKELDEDRGNYEINGISFNFN